MGIECACMLGFESGDLLSASFADLISDGLGLRSEGSKFLLVR
jgi:hypothetical protein